MIYVILWDSFGSSAASLFKKGFRTLWYEFGLSSQSIPCLLTNQIIFIFKYYFPHKFYVYSQHNIILIFKIFFSQQIPHLLTPNQLFWTLFTTNQVCLLTFVTSSNDHERNAYSGISTYVRSAPPFPKKSRFKHFFFLFQNPEVINNK